MDRRRFTNLTDLYNDWDHVVATAHRGASGCYPENTALSIRKAVEWGADMVEFDLRATRDGVPVLLHDGTLNRTSDLQGRPEDYLLAELRLGNFSHYVFGSGYSDGRTLPQPVYRTMKIPTFEEILQGFRGRVGMNVQLALDSAVVPEVCRLYRQYQMYDLAYLSVGSLPDVERIRGIDPRIEICYLPPQAKRADPDQLKLCRELGCRFVQPVTERCTPETFQNCRELGLRANVFYSNTEVLDHRLVRMGATGILTDRIDILVDCLKDMEKP